MKIFNKFSDFTNVMLNIDLGQSESINKLLSKTQKNIKKRHGRYPTDSRWEQLAPGTIKNKKRGNTPLLETGELRASYKKKKKSNREGQVISNLPKAQWMEFGVVSNKGNIPARPVVAPEAIQAKVYSKTIVAKELNESLSKKL